MYTFKFWQEMGWVALIAIVTTLAIELLAFRPEAVTDWRMWAVVMAGACTRAIAAAVLAQIGKGNAGDAPEGDQPA